MELLGSSVIIIVPYCLILTLTTVTNCYGRITRYWDSFTSSMYADFVGSVFLLWLGEAKKVDFTFDYGALVWGNL